jgi:hypothetical protein
MKERVAFIFADLEPLNMKVTVLRNVGQYLPSFAASHLRKPEPTMTNAHKVYISISEEAKRNERAAGKIILTRLLMKTIVRIRSGLD